MTVRRILACGSAVTLIILLLRLVSLSFFPLTEPSEARYAALSAEMAFSGDFVTPRIWIDGCLIPFLGKPPLFFWVQALSIQLFGMNEFGARFPCWFFAAMTVLSMGLILRESLGKLRTELACVVTAGCGFFIVMAGSIAVDMALTFGVGTAFCAYYAWLNAQSRRTERFYSLLVFFGLGISILAKGLTGVILFGMPVFVYHVIFGGWKTVLTRHSWFLGIALMLAMVLPWFILVQEALSKMNPPFNFLHYFFIEEHFHRFTSKAYVDLYGSGRIQPRGMSFVFLFLATLPFGLFAFYWLQKRFREKPGFWVKERNILWENRHEAFLLLAILVPTCFLAMARQLLITYLLPLIPVFGAWFALVWVRHYGENKHEILYKINLALVVTAVAVMALIAPFFSRLFPKMTVKELVAEAVAENPDVKLIAASRGRVYSPYFYAYNHLYDGATTDSVPVRTNQRTIEWMPCKRRMPTRLTFNGLRDLKAFAAAETDSSARLIVCHDQWENNLPDSPKFGQIPYFKIEPAPPGQKPDRIRYCGKEEAEYESLFTRGYFSIIRPLPGKKEAP